MSDESAFVDDEMEPNPALNLITNEIIGAAIEVHRHLGPGHLEAHYENALAIEFTRRGTPFRRQHPIQLLYKGEVIGEGRLDFLIREKVILDLKAIESIPRVHVATMISYLRMTHLRLGIIINFNCKLLKDGIKRIAG
jgi:GxxExxY protein